MTTMGVAALVLKRGSLAASVEPDAWPAEVRIDVPLRRATNSRRSWSIFAQKDLDIAKVLVAS